MSIDTNLAESIYAFPVSPSASFLQALQSLQDEIIALKEERDQDRQELAALRLKLVSLEKDRDTLSENQLIQLRLINDLRGEPQPLQKDRAEILLALIIANGGKMLAKDARQKMRLDKSTFSRLLDTLKDDIESKPLHSDKRKMLLIIK
ncbi:hypothetical protein [Methanothrix soehngenii]|uniref:MarR family transcriptional regulator n=1 Tax=Methanothrix soehngenii TaxID=2223 RepID=UPI00300C4DAA